MSGSSGMTEWRRRSVAAMRASSSAAPSEALILPAEQSLPSTFRTSMSKPSGTCATSTAPSRARNGSSGSRSSASQ